MILVMLAVASAQIADCSAAVHDNLAAAAQACALPEQKESIDLFGPKTGPSQECMAAFKAGENAGKFGARLPEVMRRGYVREFDAKLAVCLDPPKKEEVPTRETIKLTD